MMSSFGRLLVTVFVAGCSGAPPSTPELASFAPSARPTFAAQTFLPASILPGYAGTDWQATALPLANNQGERFVFSCPANGINYFAYGTDVYTAGSSVCTAAVHVGLITLASGGDVTIEIRPGEASYAGSVRNGITSYDSGSGSASFVVIGAGPGSPAPPTSGVVPTAPPTTTSTPSSTGSPAGGSAYVQLLSHIPPVIANTCIRDDMNAQVERALALAYCEPDDVIIDPDVTIDRLLYYLFDSDELRINSWANIWEAMGEPPDGECSAGPATSLYEVDGYPVGRLVCGQWPRSSQLAASWYDDRVDVVMFLRIDGDYEDLANLVEVASVQP